ncbi:ShlB/FhaC/HecB family hemolysin secretion/activation protein [Simiduia curdlanivorans]|uniref:ShlB/FhaC/HecB family hemolysin secretion/activation protein n=1 Tax=Simiduia curdlanivorans TaxID=1492769 RepID=A0ABV8V295_9GAMM|nr:ShlB/FhaC/HecB family hemolysin secretion/activation protein [Simiduia curdlanivorans]MDN3637335.1 ShlB/FhaC/HecB family hemolysin secretion/activation protein [Simiduia curdlanivorans]
MARVIPQYWLTLITLFSSLACLGDVNIDAAIDNQRMRVKTIVISGENDSVSDNIPMSSLLSMAQTIRAEYPEEMTFTEISLIGDRLTTFLRETGYKFHYVFLPRQNARSGVVRLNVIEVTLDDVSLLGSSEIAPAAWQNVFEALIGKPVYQPDIDARLRSLQQRPEVSLFAYYSRGSTPNSVRLNLKATKTPRHLLSTSIDNFGSESSGHNRLINNYTWLSPLDNFDRLNVGLMYAEGGASNLYGFLSYSLPLTSLDNELSVQLSNNQYEVGEEFALLELKGAAQIANVNFEQRWHLSDQQTHKLVATWSDKSVDYSNVFDDDALVNDESASMASLGWHWNMSNQRNTLTQLLTINAHQGQLALTGTEKFTTSFTYFTLNSSSHWYFGQQSLALNLSLQETDHALPSFEKLALTGVNGARGFYAGQFAADKGARASLAWMWPAYAINDLTQLRGFAFADLGQGDKLDFAGNSIDRGSLSSAGFGLSAQFSTHYYARLQWSAWNQSRMENSIEATEQPLLFDFQYRW